MGKPVINRFEPDPEWEWDGVGFVVNIDGMTGEETYTRGNGSLRIINDDNRVQVWRSFGYRPVYEERQFHASLILDLYHVYCKNCMTTTITNPEHLPHDTASRHRCLYDPKDIEDAAS